MQKDAYTAFLQADVPPKSAPRRPAGGVRVRVPDRLAQRLRREMKFVEYNLAKPAFDVRRVPDRGLTYAASAVRANACSSSSTTARSSPRKVQGGQGGEGAGGLHGRGAPDDRQGLVHRQRHRARDRLAAAPLARRVLRARQGQRPTVRASCCSRRASFPTAARGWTSSSTQGHPVLPRRPPPQDAGHDPAQGHWPEPGSHPGELLRQRQLPPDGQRRARWSSWPTA